MHVEEEVKHERGNQVRDNVYSIMMVNYEGKAYDSKLVRENTLLIIEGGIDGCLMIFSEVFLFSYMYFTLNKREL